MTGSAGHALETLRSQVDTTHGKDWMLLDKRIEINQNVPEMFILKSDYTSWKNALAR